jgi:hypothetical protein
MMSHWSRRHGWPARTAAFDAHEDRLRLAARCAEDERIAVRHARVAAASLRLWPSRPNSLSGGYRMAARPRWPTWRRNRQATSSGCCAT